MGASGQTGSEKITPGQAKAGYDHILATIALMLLENAIGIKMYLTACLAQCCWC